MSGRTLALGAATVLLLAGAAQAQSPPTDPDRPSTPGKLPPTRTAPVMGGTVRNGNGATSDDASATLGATTGRSADAAARAADARRRDCARHPPAPADEKAWRACKAVGAAPPR